MTTVAYEFRNPDGESDFAKLVACLEFLNNLPSFQKYKKQSWRLLDIQPNDTVVDLACGIGYDVAELAKAYPETKFIGVDLSRRFLDIAKSNAKNVSNVSFMQGDARAIPLEDKKCDAIRIDRSLQHIQNPGKVLNEMARVTVTGGRVVASEPDWGTFTLCNGDLETSMTLTHRNGRRHSQIRISGVVWRRYLCGRVSISTTLRSIHSFSDDTKMPRLYSISRAWSKLRSATRS